ncbi:MAG: hypothetical protein KBC35_02260 [Candidatus Pacebacteria bacterium]|nr:hypothetical protein [Candidatus Paceibacterota bacterium]
MIWIMAGIGGWLGGYIPVLWGGTSFSMSGIIFNAVGAIIGIWIGFKMTR